MNWLDELSKSLTSEPDKIPKGWLTAEQAAKIKGLHVDTMRKRFKEGVKRGILASRKLRVLNSNGHIQIKPHYGPRP